MPSSLRTSVFLLAIALLLANCAKWKLDPYDLTPQVKTGSPSSPATTSVQVECSITSLGPNALTEFGIVFSSTNQLPTISDTKVPAAGANSTAQVMLNGLQPNTTYYYRTYAINDKGLVGYGEIQSFKTATVIVDVRTLELVGTPTPTSFQTQVQVANASAVTIKEFGIVYSTTNQQPTTSDSKATASGSGATTTVSISNLQPNTTYYYRAYAISDAGTVSYGETKQIKTGEPAAVAETLDLVGTASTTAVQVGVQVSNASVVTLKEYGVVYSPSSQTPTTADSKAVASGVSGASVSLTISNLQPNTTYYYRAYAINGAGTITYGAVKQFKTAELALSVATLELIPNTLGISSAQVQIQLTNPGNSSVKELGVYYSAINQQPTAADSKVTSAASGLISVTLSNLQPNTTYYYRAYVINSAGSTSYGVTKSFKTSVSSLAIFGSKDKKLYAVNTITGIKEWEYATNGIINTSAAFSKGNVIVGGFDGYLHSVDAATGTRKWARQLSGDRFESSPVTPFDLIYIGSNDKWVSAFDINTGDLKWRYTTPNKVISSPSFFYGAIYVGCDDGRVYSIDAGTGKLLWSFNTGGYILSSPTVVGEVVSGVVNAVVYIGSSDGKLYAIDAASGKQKWVASLPDKVNSCPTVAGNNVYVGCDDYKLYAVNKTTGSITWSTQKTGYFVGGSPTYSNGVVYVGSGDKKVYAFDANTGSQKWQFTTSDEIYASPVIANGLLYIGSNDGKMYCLDAATGSKKWEFATGDEVYATPVILLNGSVIGDYPSISPIVN